jgi:SAM-dependent methyltransferase
MDIGGYCNAVSLEEWNERWRIREQLNDEPAPLLVRAAGDLAPGRALDLACGGGRNAVWLARRGWDVVAVDGSAEAIRLVRDEEARIDARLLDLETGAPLPFDDESFDLVAILFYLHRPLFAEATRLLRRGGTIVCAVRMRGRYRVQPGELARTFAGLEIVHASESEIAELIAKKR